MPEDPGVPWPWGGQGLPKELRISKLGGGDTWVSLDVFNSLTKSTRASSSPGISLYIDHKLSTICQVLSAVCVCVCLIPVKMLHADLMSNKWRLKYVKNQLCVSRTIFCILWWILEWNEPVWLIGESVAVDVRGSLKDSRPQFPHIDLLPRGPTMKHSKS